MEFANNLLESRTFERHPISVCLGGFSMDKSGICKQSFRISNIRTPSKLGLFGGGGESLWIKVEFANNLLESRTFERHPSSYK